MGRCSIPTTFVLAAIISVISSVSYSPSILVGAQKQVPCLFFFGDSQTDNGNNNVLVSLARVNYSPYGIDYPGGPTGRFANGFNVPDYIAQLLGFPNPIPPYVTNSNIVEGVNYGSGAAGILDTSGALQGQRFTMNLQLSNHLSIAYRIANLKGNAYLRKCVYVVNIGSNDYLNNYLLPGSLTKVFYPDPDVYAQYLIQIFSTQLRRLYSYGARKIAVFGVGLIGCVPQQIAAANGNGCVASVNNLVQLFNNRLKPLIDSLNSQLSGAQFTYINATNIALGDPSLVGIKVTTVACCQVSTVTGLCIPNSVPCSNRSEYAFWDNYHTTSVVNKATAMRSYRALLPLDASPVDIRTLAQQ